MKVVAISQRIDDYPDRHERRDGLDQKLCRFLTECGFFPLPVPNGLVSKSEVKNEYYSKELIAWLMTFNLDGIFLSGGNNIGSCPDRDNTEKIIIDFASQRQLPVLGICRGMQMLATIDGANLKKTNGHIRTRHILQGGTITGEVNSFHNMCIEVCPQNYHVLANSEDGEIEAIRHKELQWEGWMWHPEREDHFDVRDINRLRNLFCKISS
ncbi:gamma-glutamyl-gamma-aminobutyrate hydrolase family protein [Opitutales bacterium]|nr:gamma-glutamyl-gamma-aminobutyrate hydrolase family protein [Opitutales bacterium]